MNGVNPLGLVSNQCYQVSSDIAHLHNKNGMIEANNFYRRTNTSVDGVRCQLGFVKVCNSNETTDTTTAICPNGQNKVRGDIELRAVHDDILICQGSGGGD